MTVANPVCSMVSVTVVAVAVLLPLCTHALLFDVSSYKPRCFLETLGEQTQVALLYENPDFVPFGRVGYTGVVSCIQTR